MVSRYQQVTDPEEALKYYEAGVLYRRVLTCTGAKFDYEFLPYSVARWRFINGKPWNGPPLVPVKEHIAASIKAQQAYALVEDD